MNAYSLHIVLLLLAILAAYFFYIDTLRIKAKFALYKVRDEFVYYVAAGKIKEESEFFEFFYTAINAMLKEAPNVGIDDIISLIPAGRQSGLDKHQKAKFDAIMTDQVMSDPEVGKTVACFFSAFLLMILSHSNKTRFFYIVALRVVAPIMERINSQRVTAAAITMVSALFIVPDVARRSLDTINYVEQLQEHEIDAHC